MTPPEGGSVVEWLADVDARRPTPVYAQVATRLRAAIASGALGDGDPLPSVRQLAALLRINPATVVQAYRALETEGFAELRQGSGTFVRRVSPERKADERATQARRLATDVLARAARAGLSAGDLRRALDELSRPGSNGHE